MTFIIEKNSKVKRKYSLHFFFFWILIFNLNPKKIL
jgi:hypothetical protein